MVDVPQRSSVIREIACIEYLDASVVLPVKGSHGVWAACLNCILRVVEPQTQMVKLDRISDGIHRGIRKRRIVEHERSVSGRCLRNDESLNAKPTDERLMTDA